MAQSALVTFCHFSKQESITVVVGDSQGFQEVSRPVFLEKDYLTGL